MKYVVLVVRLILGLGFTVLGLDYFLHFMTMPAPELTPAAANFMKAIDDSGYLSAVKAFEVVDGVLLLTGIVAPLGLVLLMPVIANIFFFDVFLMREPGLSFALLPMAIFLIWAYRPYFAGVFTIGARPSMSR